MHIGIYWGYVAMMEGLVARLKAEIGRPVKVIATGGLATLFDEHTGSSTRSRATSRFRGWRCCMRGAGTADSAVIPAKLEFPSLSRQEE